MLTNNKAVEKLVKTIENNSEFYISSHVNPDGDSLGSTLGLALALIKKGKKVIIPQNDSLPTFYKFLPGIELIKNLKKTPKKIDVFIVLDSSDEDRLGKNKDLLKLARTKINIDHHKSNRKFGDINIVNPNAAATGELVFELLKPLKIDLDKDIAENLYVAISTDTGSFRYEGVSSKTHKIISELIDSGIKTSEININLYESISLERSKLFINSISEMKTYYNNSLAIVKVSQEILSKYQASWEDTEDIVSFIRSIKGVEVACLLKELKKDEIKVSLRSKAKVDVSQVCSLYGGGGHIRAAGCTINSEIDIAEKDIVDKLKNFLR